MKKQYTNPALAVITLKHSDIVTVSDPASMHNEVSSSDALAPDRFNDWE